MILNRWRSITPHLPSQKICGTPALRFGRSSEFSYPVSGQAVPDHPDDYDEETKRRFREALRLYDRAKRNPSPVRWQQVIGLANRNPNPVRWRQVIEAFQDVLSSEPDYEEAKSKLSEAERQLLAQLATQVAQSPKIKRHKAPHWRARIGLIALVLALVVGVGSLIRFIWAGNGTSITPATQVATSPLATAVASTTASQPPPAMAVMPTSVEILGFQVKKGNDPPVVYQSGEQISARAGQVIEIKVLLDHPVEGLTFSWTTSKSGVSDRLHSLAPPIFRIRHPKKVARVRH